MFFSFLEKVRFLYFLGKGFFFFLGESFFYWIFVIVSLMNVLSYIFVLCILFIEISIVYTLFFILSIFPTFTQN